ncbi:MAG TPA: peptidoglycan-binding domain-containing protein [Terriglobales bacterium]|nr:peptidoglycan-binding domain-containing protein [Terriglobales bacterium]
MRGNGSRRIFAAFSALLLLSTVAAAKTNKTSHKQTTAHKSSKQVASHHSRHSRSRHSRRMAWKYRGQQRPDSERTREIQEALARQNYLHATPTGVWDQNTRAAMARFQENHGWQTKMVPDARALIALGLGPSSNGLINPETAMTSAPLAGGAADRDLPSSGAPFRQ